MATQQQKRAAVITTKIDEERGYLVLTFPRIRKELSVNPADLDLAIVQRATYHGLKQKLIDAAAIARDPETGKSATDATKYEAVAAVLSRLNAGEWLAPREGGDGSTSMLVKALIRYHGGKKTRAEVEDWLKTKSDTEKKALRANPKVSAIIAQITAEAADDSIDSDELLSELE